MKGSTMLRVISATLLATTLFFSLALATNPSAASSSPQLHTGQAAVLTSSTQAHTPRRWIAMRWAESQAGKHYVYGAAGPSTYDCSGLVMRAYQHAGISLPHNTGAMVGSGKLIRTSHPHWGDLAFFGSGHVELFDYWKTHGFESFGAHSSSHPIIGWRYNIRPYWATVRYYTVRGAN
jgi:cell wall-associated NlpC family hydrolase